MTSPMEARCVWCGGAIPRRARKDALTCSRKCRQAHFRLRRRIQTQERHGAPMRMAYADPPYPKRAYRYKGEIDYGGEVDHRELVARLLKGWPDGWALSTSMKALREILPMCPRDVHVCPWVKPIGVPRSGRGLFNRWEALLVVGGRQDPPGKIDWLEAKPARFGGTLVGRKPIAFCAFLFDALGLRRGDVLDDLFPGTGIVGRAWQALNASPDAGGNASPRTSRDVSPEASRDVSPEYSRSGTGETSPTAGRYGYPTIEAVDLSACEGCSCLFCWS